MLCLPVRKEGLPFKLTEGSKSTPVSNGVPPLSWISYVLLEENKSVRISLRCSRNALEKKITQDCDSECQVFKACMTFYTKHKTPSQSTAFCSLDGWTVLLVRYWSSVFFKQFYCTPATCYFAFLASGL